MFILQDNRVQFNQNYSCVFGKDHGAMDAIAKSEEEPSLADLVERWLERTPGLEVNLFDFWGKYKHNVNVLLKEQYDAIMVRYR